MKLCKHKKVPFVRVVYCITSVSDRFSNLKRFFFSNEFSLRKTVSSSLSFSSSSSAVKLCVKDSTWASSLVDDVPSVDKKSFLRGLFFKGSSARVEFFVFLTFLEPSYTFIPCSTQLGWMDAQSWEPPAVKGSNYRAEWRSAPTKLGN